MLPTTVFNLMTLRLDNYSSSSQVLRSRGLCIVPYLTMILVVNSLKPFDQGFYASFEVSDFFSRSDDLFNEMKWQKKLRGRKL